MSMNAEHEAIIERFLSGTLSPAERLDVLRRAEGDAELRRHLQAERLIGSAVARERASMPGLPAGSRAQFLTMLASVSKDKAPAPPPPVSTANNSPLRYLPGSGRSRAIVTVMIGAVLIVGAMLLMPRTGDQQPTPGNAPGTQPVPAATPAAIPATPPAPHGSEATATQPGNSAEQQPATVSNAAPDRAATIAGTASTFSEDPAAKSTLRKSGAATRQNRSTAFNGASRSRIRQSDTLTENDPAKGTLLRKPPITK